MRILLLLVFVVDPFETQEKEENKLPLKVRVVLVVIENRSTPYPVMINYS